MRISIAGTVDDVLKKYTEAEKVIPVFERVTVFSWNDMMLLKTEIERLRAELLTHNVALSEAIK